ncbi:MAG: hypothetical protein UX13_C0039G0015 [Candidatus Woesebacteria bacterium GW2011_GWB1_45_5]|uniref:Uncharacterized protein n=1 Tax=Candidatus Woesebacteria bacterium GW2011_GWB1_45_5 TaxID=1618581 RepID=A0A0G1QLE9_9BACT|nr:MAG: hypothetical protein UX13_C0039G0015 [Candidatus Woesebacteria bacterium GW2011_GWB1_45_5]
MSTRVDAEVPTPEIALLQENTEKAFRLLIEDPEKLDLWKRFRFTYEERRKLPWLTESGQFLGWRLSGLGGALANAFFNFDAKSEDRLIDKNKTEGMFLDVDSDFKQALHDAVKDAIAYETNVIKLFASYLQRGGVDISQLGSE